MTGPPNRTFASRVPVWSRRRTFTRCSEAVPGPRVSNGSQAASESLLSREACRNYPRPASCLGLGVLPPSGTLSSSGTSFLQRRTGTVILERLEEVPQCPHAASRRARSVRVSTNTSRAARNDKADPSSEPRRSPPGQFRRSAPGRARRVNVRTARHETSRPAVAVDCARGALGDEAPRATSYITRPGGSESTDAPR